MAWMTWPRLLSLILLLPVVFSIQANLAGVVDWHKPLLGEPLLEPTPPSLVETSKGRRAVVITKKNIFGVLDEAGEIVWRHLLDERDPVVSYHVNGDSVLLLSGPSASTARLFSLITGHAIWEQSLHQTDEVRLTTPVHLGTDATFTSKGDVVILSDGRRVSRLNGKTGEISWSLDAPGAGSTILFKQIYVSGTTVHILALTNAFASQTLTTLSLSLDTSAPLNDLTQIPSSSIKSPKDAILAASEKEGEARIVWHEIGKIKSALIGTNGALIESSKTKELKPKKGLYTKILPVGSRHFGFVLGQTDDGSVDIIDVRNGGSITESFEYSADHPDRSPSVYSATKYSQGVVFNRVYWSFNMKMGACQTYLISSTERQIINSGFTFPFDTASNGIFLHAAPSSKVNNAQLVTLLITSSSGAVQMIRNEGQMWLREESLSDLAAVRFIDLGEPEVEHVGHLMEEEGFIGRTARHLAELRTLPAYLYKFAMRLTSSTRSTLTIKPLSLDNLHRDQFGFQKLVVAITHGGKLFALDSANGNIIWSRNLGFLNQNGPELEVRDMWVVRDHSQGGPVLAVLATRHREGPETVAFHVNALTGHAGASDSVTGLPNGKVLFDGPAKSAFLLPYENCSSKNKVLGVVDSEAKLHIFPYCKKMAREIANDSHKLFFTTVDRTPEGLLIKGQTPVPGSTDEEVLQSRTLWTKQFNLDEKIDIIPTIYNSIAAFGKVKGDKSTLYKYLNPHLTAITSVSPTGFGQVSIVDSITGKSVYEVEIVNLDTKKGIIASMIENWLVYRWLDKSTNGWRVASVELYEDRLFGKPETPGLSSFVSGHNITSFSHTFIMPYGINSMSFTTSKAGVTAKDLIYINSDGQLAHLPQRLLDPRRPIGKPTTADKEEMLIPFDPSIPFEPKRIISHKYQILGGRTITSSPALLESTSLILISGIDLFLTRGLNPSGTFDILSEGFNKAQLVLTLAGLSVGIAIAEPAVRRKMLGMRWY